MKLLWVVIAWAAIFLCFQIRAGYTRSLTVPIKEEPANEWAVIPGMGKRFARDVTDDDNITTTMETSTTTDDSDEDDDDDYVFIVVIDWIRWLPWFLW